MYRLSGWGRGPALAPAAAVETLVAAQESPISPKDPVIRVLGGSWVVISGVVSRVTMLITHIGGLITPFITTHEPPSRV